MEAFNEMELKRIEEGSVAEVPATTASPTVGSEEASTEDHPVVSPKTEKAVHFDENVAEGKASVTSSDQGTSTDEEVDRRIAESAHKALSKQALLKAKNMLERSGSSRSARRRSPLPPNMSAAEEIKHQLDRMELKIQKAAKMELALLNQSKKLREQRTAYQRRYEKMSTDYRDLVQKSSPENNVVAPTFSLPPVFPKPGVVDLTDGDNE